MLLALAGGAAVRALFVARHPGFDGDTLIYGDLAHNMLAHHVYGLTEDVIRPTLLRLPGYPLFLALCFAVFGTGKYLAVLWVQVVVGLATCALVGDLAGRLFGRRAGRVALWAACLCPFTANYDALALAECWSFFCVALACWSVERWAAERRMCWAALVGAACAWAVLLRPEQGLLAAGMVGAMLFAGRAGWRERVRGAAVVCVIVAAPLGVWTARNWRVFHVVQPLAPKYANDPGEFVSAGFYRWYRSWAAEYLSTTDTYWLYDGSAMDVNDLPDRAFDTPAQRAETEQAYAAYNDVQSATPAVDAQFARLAEERVRAHPLRQYLVMPVARELDMWLRPRTEFMGGPLDWWEWNDHPGWSAMSWAYAALDWAYIALAVAGLWRWRGWRRTCTGWAMVGFVALRCALLLTIDNSEPRYTLECFPVMFVLMGALWWEPRAREGPASQNRVMSDESSNTDSTLTTAAEDSAAPISGA